MTDITKCGNSTCAMRETCWRFRAPSNPHRQSFAAWDPEQVDGVWKCSGYWNLPTARTKLPAGLTEQERGLAP